MSNVFTFIIALLVMNIFLGWVLTEIGQEANIISLDVDPDADPLSEASMVVKILDMLISMITFSIEGVPHWCQVLIFGTLNLCMAVAFIFLFRGVG